MAMGALMRQETYLPDEDGEVDDLFRFLTAHEDVAQQAQPYYALAGPAPDDRVPMPMEVYRVLRKVVEALQQGLAVTIVPSTQTLTTQQAADLLGISRPTLVKLLEDGRIPFERGNKHRRVALRDILAYREQRRAEQYAALEATAIDADDAEDLATVLSRLREARRAVGNERRQRAPP